MYISDGPLASSEITDKLAKAAQALGREQGVITQYCEAYGDPYSALMKCATEHHADLIVVGAGRKIGRRVQDSASIRLVRSSGASRI
jgi:nucleotide-binding universal stress UspA family protein